MPYNNQAIQPDEPGEAYGVTVLPLARVKKVINYDEDVSACSAQAAFAITKATELFVWYLTEKSWTASKTDNKVKRSLRYQDISQIVARTDNLEFLNDMIPQTTTVRAHRERMANEAGPGKKTRANLPTGQQTLDGTRAAVNEETAPSKSNGAASRPGTANGVHAILNGPPPTNGNTNGFSKGEDLKFRHYDPHRVTGSSGGASVQQAVGYLRSIKNDNPSKDDTTT